MRWRVYYADGSTFDDTDGPWEAAPSRGVMCVTAPSTKLGCRTPQGRNFYVMGLDGQPYGMDWPGLWDHLIRIDSPEAHRPLRDVDLDALCDVVKFGRMVAPEVFAPILVRAQNDPDFPARSARDPDDERTGEA